MPETAATDEIIAEVAFRDIITVRLQPILGIARHLERRALHTPVLSRPLLGRIQSEAAQLEELLDAYGASCNCRWYPLRHLMAVGKLFANAGYKALHIQHRLRAYRLLPVEGDFERATTRVLLFTGTVLMQFGCRLVEQAKALGLALPQAYPGEHDFAETLPPGRLPRDRTLRSIESASETVAHLATAFLNLAAESDLLHVHESIGDRDCGCLIPDPVSEEDLRLLEQKFHNLQSLYDTFVSDTDTETLDEALPILRGHISAIYHLLEIATLFTHYYERHIMTSSDETATICRPLVNPIDLVHTLFGYAVAYASRYLVVARGLCHDMLKRYAEIGRIVVPVPRYRGFHVRPSTLLSKIIHHYGSEVRMELGGDMYDASAPLDLFRANEKINAIKRQRLAEFIAHMPLQPPAALGQDMIAAVRHIVATLATQGKVVIYNRPLPLEELQPHDGESISQFALDEITRMLAMGKIDIESQIHVAFNGDKRVLADIQLLAESGYGEDVFGNNVPLPKALEYLRR